MKRPYFICHRSKMWEDGWTYGEWRQYICERPGGETQCARSSNIPFLLFSMSFGLLFSGLLIIWMAPAHAINWNTSPIYLAVNAAICTATITTHWRGWRLMRAVGPMNRGTHRVMPWEEK